MPEPNGDRNRTAPTTELPVSRRRCLELTGLMLMSGAGVGAASARDAESAAAADDDVTGRASEPAGESDTDEAPVVGGGTGYENTVEPDQADVTVGTRSELQDALGNASSGDVVYVAGDATIDMGGAEWSIPEGVTLASDRGIDGAPGGHLQTTDLPWPMFVVRANARVTGLRVSGQYDEYVDLTDGPVSIGLQVAESGVEIDNNEVFGFSHAAIRPFDDTHVHHNDVHHNPMDGLGYGVSVTRGEPLIEYNYFNYNRHSVAGSGNCGYTARYNHFGPETVDHVIDQHEPGGTTMEIHHNTVEAVSHVQDGGEPEAVAIRGTPDDVAAIHHNWFYNPDEPKSTPADWDGSAITQVHTSDWANVEYEANHYGSDEPDPDVGCPR
ncbi:hypothetical protein ACAH01_15435 [Halomicrobium sp. HM KBTZ05]|uniref:hypothetical protein n=1 Tax=Halomicrobium sp. HM KBTZ05 TaxID=3242663 RepID=UPI003557EDE2